MVHPFAGKPQEPTSQRFGRTIAGANESYEEAKNWPSSVANMPSHLPDGHAVHQHGGWATGEGPVTKGGDYPLV